MTYKTEEVAENRVDRVISVNGHSASEAYYFEYHKKRIDWTLRKLHEIGAKRIVEVGSHPWVMTSSLIDDPTLKVCATVSAEELTNWPDDIGVKREQLMLRSSCRKEAPIVNYSANIERTRFEIAECPDTVLASEIIEHLLRSPHVMLLNINNWLPVGGKLLLTTPNGAQFSNPFRRRSPTPAYRSHIYERHSYLYALNDLIELITLCGFKILEGGYWDVIERIGLSRIYGLLSRVPLPYFQEKFKKTIYVIAEKEKDVTGLERCPRVYDSRGNWEYIAQ